MLRKRVSLLAVLLILMPLAVVVMAGRKTACTEEAEAGPDFAVQGEYEGTVATDEGDVKYGAQIIALGDGKFRAVGYAGGLPGAGWDKGEKVVAEGQTEHGATTFLVHENHSKAIIKDGLITIEGPDGEVIGKLKKVHRKSPTLGAKPPADATDAAVLFDGTTPEKFKGGRMTKDGLLMEGVTSKQNFQSFKIHIEFRTPLMPQARGQARGNSGYYAQGRYEVQILDSFGLEGRDNECGGIYQIARPAVNMCLPPLSWQTFDVDFTAAVYKDGKRVSNPRMTVLHNGVKIHDNLELTHATAGGPLGEGPQPGPVYLQDHGNPVRFRNIWVVPKK